MHATPETLLVLKFGHIKVIEGRKYAIVEAILLSGAEPTKSGHSSQQVSQTFWCQICAGNVQFLELGLFPLDGLHMLAQ